MTPSVHLVKNVLWWISLARRYQTLTGSGYDGRVHVSQVLQPVTVVDHLLDRPRILNVALVAADDGLQTLFTVPPGKMWELYAYEVRANATGSYTYTFQIADLPANNAVIRYLGPTASTSGTIVVLPGCTKLAAGWIIQTAIGTFVSAGTNSTFEVQVVERDWVDDRVELPAA